MPTTWPTVEVGIAFGSGVGDPTPTYVDVAAASALSLTTQRGRSYELDTSQPGQMTVPLDDPDGRYAPPGPTGTPYAGLVKLFTPVRLRATWAGVTYPLWAGYVQKWPTTYDPSGIRPQTPLAAIGVLSVLSRPPLATMLRQEVLNDNPTAYWPLDDPQGSRTAESLIQDVPAATLIRTGAGGTAAFGAESDLPGDSGSVLQLTGVFDAGTVNAYDQGYRLTFPPATAGGPSIVIPPGAAAAASFEYWVRIPAGTQTTTNVTTLGSPATNDTISAQIDGSFGVSIIPKGNPSGAIGPVGAIDDLRDGNFHQVACTLLSDGTTLTVKTYVDGALNGTETSTALATSGITTAGQQLGFGAPVDLTVGTYGHIAFYDTALPASRISSHYEAGATLNAGEPLSARATRVLGYLPAAIPSQVGVTSSRSNAVNYQSTVGAELQAIATSEGGNLFEDGAGHAVLTGRQARWNLTPQHVFGEHTTAGELPYTSIAYDYDDTYVYNDVAVSRTNGGTGLATSSTSEDQYGPRALTQTREVDTDAELADAANYLLAQYEDPHERISSITIQPGRNPALWPVALGCEIGTRVTVNRRAAGAPAKTGDFIVEAVGHTADGKTGEWATTFQLSPADTRAYWRLEDPTFGQIDSTNAIAY